MKKYLIVAYNNIEGKYINIYCKTENLNIESLKGTIRGVSNINFRLEGAILI